MGVSLTFTEDQHAALNNHLFPGDGLEAVAFLACGRAASGDRHRLALVRQIFPIAHDRCQRTPVSVSWNAEDIENLLYAAEVEKLSLVKVHSHPGGFDRFSEVDDASDAANFCRRSVPGSNTIFLMAVL